MMTTNLFVTANVKQLRTGCSFRIVLPLFQTSWSVGILNSAILTVFTIGLCLARFWRAFGISRGGVWKPPSVRHCKKLKNMNLQWLCFKFREKVPTLLKLKDGGVMDGRMHGEKDRNEHLFTHSLTFWKKRANNLSLSEVMYKFCVSTVTTC